MRSFLPDSHPMAEIPTLLGPPRSRGFPRKCSSTFSRGLSGTSQGLITRAPKTTSVPEGAQIPWDVGVRTITACDMTVTVIGMRLKIFHGRPRRVP